MCNYDTKLSDLLTKTENAYAVIKFPSFKNAVIYEEDFSADYKRVFKWEVPPIKGLNLNNYISLVYVNEIFPGNNENNIIKLIFIQLEKK